MQFRLQFNDFMHQWFKAEVGLLTSARNTAEVRGFLDGIADVGFLGNDYAINFRLV